MLVPVHTARAELHWLARPQPDLALAEVRPRYDQAAGKVDPWTIGAPAIWLLRLGRRPPRRPAAARAVRAGGGR